MKAEIERYEKLLKKEKENQITAQWLINKFLK